MHKFAVKVISDEDEAYDYISDHDGDEAEELEAAYKKDAEDVYYFVCYLPQDKKDQANEAGSIFRDEGITEQYEENWGKIAVVCPLEELEGKSIESNVYFDVDEDNELILKAQEDVV